MIETMEKPGPTEAELRELGLTEAANKVKRARDMAPKLRTAFEHFRVVTREHLECFQGELIAKAMAASPYSTSFTYKSLKFTALERYPEVPPREVLQKIRAAKELKCFDRFEVLTLESAQLVPDPVVFGLIDGCDNRYFVAEWDDDVKIEDILREDEG
jgi:hypothetical protein